MDWHTICWYRCSIVGSIAVGTTARVTLSITDIITAAGFEAANLADNDSIIAWGFDIEIGAFPTSYIKTTTVAVARNADVILTTDVSWYNSTASTMYMVINVQNATAGNERLWSIHDNSASDRWDMIRASVDNAQSTYRSDDGTQRGSLTVVDGLLTLNTSLHSVSACAEDDFEVFVEGTRAGTGDQAVTPLMTGVSDLNIGSLYDESNNFNGHIVEIRYYNVRKDNQFLEDLSNGLIQA